MIAGNILKPDDLLVARYKIREFVGAGGMQEVYRADDLVLERVQ